MKKLRCDAGAVVEQPSWSPLRPSETSVSDIGAAMRSSRWLIWHRAALLRLPVRRQRAMLLSTLRRLIAAMVLARLHPVQPSASPSVQRPIRYRALTTSRELASQSAQSIGEPADAVIGEDAWPAGQCPRPGTRFRSRPKHLPLPVSRRQFHLDRVIRLCAIHAISDEWPGLPNRSTGTTTPNTPISTCCAPLKIAGDGRGDFHSMSHCRALA